MENTTPSGTSIVVCATFAALTWHLQRRFPEMATSAGSTILAFSRHATV
jgi:hypothetical protein